MLKKLKISFDFDFTLSEPHIQELAKFFVNIGADVWILTAREDDAETISNTDNPAIYHCGYNSDLRRIAKKVGIPLDKILYTGGSLKHSKFFENKFDYHFDDDLYEVNAINTKGGTAFMVRANISELKDLLFNELVN